MDTPHSWPVVAASTGLTSRTGELLAGFLGLLVNLEQPRLEDLSMEEAISQLEEAETMIRHSGDSHMMVGSLNMKALYPSLYHEETAELAANLVLLACNMDKDTVKREGLAGLQPGRLHKKGRYPGPNQQGTVHEAVCGWTGPQPKTLGWKLSCWLPVRQGQEC